MLTTEKGFAATLFFWVGRFFFEGARGGERLGIGVEAAKLPCQDSPDSTVLAHETGASSLTL